jgi:hypothetical protein
MFIPFYGLIVFWRFLRTIRTTQLQTRTASAISPVPAFWWSCLWFKGGPYINGHLKAVDNLRKRQGKGSAAGAAFG